MHFWASLTYFSLLARAPGAHIRARHPQHAAGEERDEVAGRAAGAVGWAAARASPRSALVHSVWIAPIVPYEDMVGAQGGVGAPNTAGGGQD